MTVLLPGTLLLADQPAKHLCVSRRCRWLARALVLGAVALVVAPWPSVGRATHGPGNSVDSQPRPSRDRGHEHGGAAGAARVAQSRATPVRSQQQSTLVRHPARPPVFLAPLTNSLRATSSSQLEQQAHALNVAIQSAARGTNATGLSSAGETSVAMPSQHDSTRIVGQLTAASSQLTPREPALELEERAASPPQLQHEKALILSHMLSATQQPFAADGSKFIERTHNPKPGVRIACVPALCQASVSGTF